MIYSDERRERLDQLERRAREELGLEQTAERTDEKESKPFADSESLRFVDQHRRRVSQGLFSFTSGIGLVVMLIVVIIVGLLLIL